jgi:hypothetical protein
LAERALDSLSDPDSGGGELAHDDKTSAKARAPAHIF